MDEHTRRRLAAMRRQQLGIISGADREIVGIYQRAQEEMARQARNARSGSLTERWLTDYSRSLTDTVGQMRRDIYGTVRDAATRAAALPVEETARWLDATMARAGVDGSFRSVLSRAPTDAIRAVIDGRMYRDGVTLSRRIWDQTGLFQHGVEDVITQGLAQQQGLVEISRALEQYLAPGQRAPIDIRRLYPNMGTPAKGGRPIPATYQVEYNSLRLARTALNHAQWGANKAAAKLNPLCTGMKWILSADHFTRQIAKWGPDVCDDYAKHDEGLGLGVYPVDKLPMPHPQCLCRQEQVIPTTDDAVARLNRWLNGGSDPALEQGFQLAKKRAALDSGGSRGIIDSANREMAHGNRTSAAHVLSPGEIRALWEDIRAIRADPNAFRINVGERTGYRDMDGYIGVKGDVLPAPDASMHPRDQMSSRAVLAHEYYGHYEFAPSQFAVGDWRDEMRASYIAAIKAPNLSDDDRRLLMLDAYERAKEGGRIFDYSKKAREIIYGY